MKNFMDHVRKGERKEAARLLRDVMVPYQGMPKPTIANAELIIDIISAGMEDLDPVFQTMKWNQETLSWETETITMRHHRAVHHAEILQRKHKTDRFIVARVTHRSTPTFENVLT